MIFLYIYIMADNFPNEELEKELYLSIAQANLGTLKNHIERRGRDVNEYIFFIDLDYGDFKVRNKIIAGFPTPLQVALVYENYKIAEYLLKKGADPNVVGDIIFYNRGKLCETPKPLEIALYYDIPRDDPGGNFETPLIGSNRNIIKLLLNKGANANNTIFVSLDDYVDEYFQLKDEGVDVAVIDESLANINFIIENISGEATRLEHIFKKAYNRNDEKLIRILSRGKNIREIATLVSEFDRDLSDSTNSIINTLDTPGAGSLRDILSTRGNFGNYGGKKKRKSLKKKRKTKRRKSLKKKQRKTKRKSRK